MSQYYTIVKQKQIMSKYGNNVMEITLVGLKDRITYRTFVDPQNRNFKYWSEIIHNPSHGYLLSNLQIKDTTKALISADSHVEILFVSDNPQDIYDEVLALWHEPQSQYSKFFE